MGSKAVLVVWLVLLAVVLLVPSEVAARDLAETTKTTHQASESTNKLEDAKYGGYPGGGYGGYAGGGYPGHGGGGYPGHGGGGYPGGGGGGYPSHGGGGCRYGCCGHGYYGRCRCCTSAAEDAAQAAATTQP